MTSLDDAIRAALVNPDSLEVTVTRPACRPPLTCAELVDAANRRPDPGIVVHPDVWALLFKDQP